MTIRQKMKEGIKTAAFTYAVLGSLVNIATPTTGHYSADLTLGLRKLTSIECAIYKPIFEEYTINSSVDDHCN